MKYKAVQKLGYGAFGAIYSGVDLDTKRPIAIKIGSAKTGSTEQLKWEYKIYQTIGGQVIKTIQGKPCTWPRAYDLTRDKSGNYVMVMDLLGPSLDNIVRKNSGKLSPAVISYLAIQCIQLVRFFHNRGFIHRDLKPQNFCFEQSYENFPQLHLIDYGLAKQYLNKTRNEHAPYVNKNGLRGTLRYLSVSSHFGIGQSRRDDMQSLGYIFVFLATGKLPWQQLPRLEEKKEDYIHIMRTKMATTHEDLVADVKSQELKMALLEYLFIVSSLGYMEKPPYDYLQGLFLPLIENWDGQI